MSNVSAWLTLTIRAHVASTAIGGSSAGETRLIFHGPPMEILSEVYETLKTEISGGSPLALPVLLQVPRLEPDEANPPIGASGRCDETHLLDLRNSPTASSYLALVPPGHHAIRSVSSTTDEFGVTAANNGANVSFDDWLADPFIQRTIAGAIEQTKLSATEPEEAQELIKRALRAVDDVDPEKSIRLAAWRLISRLYDIDRSDASAAALGISLACGVPPLGEGLLSAHRQQSTLDNVASALSDGVGSGLAGALEVATADQALWLEAFLSHIRARCEVPTALERAPEAFYAPDLTRALVEPPDWWKGLTAEVWAELLSEEPDASGDIQLECRAPLLPSSKGTPLLVMGPIELAVRASEQGPVAVTLERSPGKNTDGFPRPLTVDGEESFLDATPPRHKAPIHYKALAVGHRTASIKIVSLNSWIPGIFVACRLARKIAPPKQARRSRSGPEWETSLSLPGPGRYEILVYLSQGGSVEPEATGTFGGERNGGEDSQALIVREVRPGLHQIEVEAEASYQIDLQFTRLAGGKPVAESCRVFLSCEDVVEEGCRSEFERLIRWNRRQLDPSGAKPVIQLNRSARASSLQGWMLQEDAVSHSFLPLVLATDYADHWIQPKWSDEAGRILSAGRYLKDPRPRASEFTPPAGFLDSRRELAALIRGQDDQAGLVEAAPLGEWLRQRDDFPTLIENYLDAYSRWLTANPEVAAWVDVVVVASLDPGGRTLSRVPDAVLLSPLHPLRLAWHALAQGVLYSAASGDRPCPAAGVLDPGTVPDIMRMPLVSPEGVERVPFLAVESNSDYWSVLWNGTKLRNLPERSQLAPFGAALGVTVGGISNGFSANQVIRALDDVSSVLCAKPIISVVVTSAGGTTDTCNEGLVAWSAARYADGDKATRGHAAGPTRLDVFDGRGEGSRPDEAAIANLSEDTQNQVRWFTCQPKEANPDLGIIAQLDSSEPEASETPTLSPLGAGGLIRHRVRRQLPGAFLSESRQARRADPTGDPLADKIAACISTLESSGDRAMGLRFAPNVHAIGEMLDDKKTDFVAVSSSAVDPACFLGGWLDSYYLWDYDLPSYSHRAGDTNGYYLISRVKPSDRDGLRKVLSRLQGCNRLDDTQVEAILLEVARRGIPTIRGLAGDDTGATGELGLFVAARLIQDRFRTGASANSLLSIIGGTTAQPTISLVIPVDPFRGYLEDLARAVSRPDTSLSRPDLLVAGISLDSGRAQIHLTPVEVKCRLGTTFPAVEVGDALGQAKALGRLLEALANEPDRLAVWRLAYQHLLLSMIGFGMRVYSQHQDLAGSASDWANFHEQIAAAILSQDGCVTIDARGRLVVVDDRPISDALDHDGDGFEETIAIGVVDAGRIVAGDAQGFYDSVIAKVGEWGLGAGPVHAKPRDPIGGAAPVVHTPESPAIRPEETKGSADEIAPSPDGDSLQAVTGVPATSEAGGGIHLAVGSTVDGFDRREVFLALSDTRLNQLNMGVVGDLGTGKTQLLKSLVLQITSSAGANRGIRPRVLIFDYKRDYSSKDFVDATGARVVRPHRLPLNLFDTSTMEDSTAPWLGRFRFFADVLDKIYSGIGPVQRDKLKRAVRSAYEAGVDQGAPTIYDIHAAYRDLLDGKSDSPMAIIDDLVDMEIFEADLAKTRSFNDFLDGVVVVSLDALGQDDRSKNMLVAVMLNMFYENMLRTPKRPFLGTGPQLRAIDSYLLVDEADNIMRYEFDVLRKLLLQGREFGTGVILASQYLRHFKVNATDYREPLLTWFVHKVPNVTPAELGALGLSTSAAEMAERVKTLPNHHCLYKSFDVPGHVIRGLPFYELVAAGRTGE